MFSFASDIGLQKNFRVTQQYLALGPTLHAIFHLNPKNGVYLSYGFFSNGWYRNNNLIAAAKQSSTSPSLIFFDSRSAMQLQQFSVGWHGYLKGRANIEYGWNLFSSAGFGLTSGTVSNRLSESIDTSRYHVPILGGESNLTRLTFDLSLGAEVPISADIYAYGQLRTWIPTRSYPSRYLLENSGSPSIGLLCGGVRILF